MIALPEAGTTFIGKSWDEIEPQYRQLLSFPLTEASAEDFLMQWSILCERMDETHRRLEIATTQNTADKAASERYQAFLKDVFDPAKKADQQLRERFLRSGIEPDGFQIPLRKMRVEAELFREENLPLQNEEKQLIEEYFSLRGAQTVQWEGEEIPIPRLSPMLQDPDRGIRERAWRLRAERQLKDRKATDGIWAKLFSLRQRIAANAGLRDFREYRWRQMKRFDYTPDDCKRFHASIEEVVVPAVRRLQEKRRQQLGIDSLRPWDLQVDPFARPPLQPYQELSELIDKLSAVFHRVDPELGDDFDIMAGNELLDLEVRKNKAPVGYCLPLNASRLPFIFLHCVGIHDDVEGLLHEGGHAFHVFEAGHLPYFWQRDLERMGMEFAEVGSMAMELLAAPYLASDEGGFYSQTDARRALAEHLEGGLGLWCYIAIIDAFQHWVYENPDQATNPAACDAQFTAQSQRFLPDVDWTGLERERTMGWRTVPHPFEVPFYFIDYGLAQLGAVQIWASALKDQQAAVKRYRHALSLGETRTVPELFEVAGGSLAFDAETLGFAVRLMEAQLESSEGTTAP